MYNHVDTHLLGIKQFSWSSSLCFPVRVGSPMQHGKSTFSAALEGQTRHSQRQRSEPLAPVQPPQGYWAFIAKCRFKLGHFLHTNMAESIIMLLVTTELCMALLEIGVETRFLCLFHVDTSENLDDAFICETAEGQRTAFFLESIESMSRLIVCLFVVEIMLKLVVAPCQIVQNRWLFLDFIVVSLNVFITFVLDNQAHCGARRTLLLRSWRVFKCLKLMQEEADLVEERIKKKLLHEMSHGSLRVQSDIVSKQVEVSSSLGPETSTASFAKDTAKTCAQIGGGIGTIVGTTIGGGLGILPAFFTFGISIPVFAAVGGGTGLFCGSAATSLVRAF